MTKRYYFPLASANYNILPYSKKSSDQKKISLEKAFFILQLVLSVMPAEEYSFFLLNPKHLPLLVPVLGEAFAELGEGECGGFFAVEDGFDDVRGEVDQT